MSLDNTMIGALAFVVLIGLLVVRVPVGIAMIAVSVGGYSLVASSDAALVRFAPDAVGAASVQGLSVIPMFIMMGLFMERSGLGTDLYRLFNALLWRIRGGMATATIGAAALFGAVNGSALASTSTMSLVAVPEMRAHGYDDRLSAGTAAVGGTLGMLIPPSATLVLYGLITEEPIGAVLIAGLLPGMLCAVLLMVTAYVLVVLRPSLAPPRQATRTGITVGAAVLRAWPVPVIFGISMGGIYLGIFTATEAGAVGAASCLVYGILTRRLKLAGLWEALSRTVSLSATIFLIVIGGKMFGFFLSVSGIPRTLTDWVSDLSLHPMAVIAIIYAIYFVLGALMDELAILVIMTPLVYPIVIAIGFDGVWFGVLTVLMLMTGLLAPPVGIVSFVVSGITGIRLDLVFRGIAPFMIPLAVTAALVVIFPDIVLLLPELMD